MRKLTKQQIKILDFHKHIKSAHELPYEVLEELEQINNTEILYEEFPFISIESWGCVHEDGQEFEQII